MARTLDIPSRVVLGFTPGTQQSDGTIVVRDRNAHAWVELWMPTQGWVRFDPTPRRDEVNPTTYEEIETSLGFPLTEYLDVPGFAPIGGGEVSPGNGFELPSWLAGFGPWLGGLLLLFAAIPFMKRWRRRRRLRRLRSGDISAAWDEIVSRLDDFGTPSVSGAASPPTPATSCAPPWPGCGPRRRPPCATVDPAMEPLAVVYGRSLYGATGTLPDGLVNTATVSMEQTSKAIRGRHSGWQRLKASYRIRTLLPTWWKRRRSR